MRHSRSMEVFRWIACTKPSLGEATKPRAASFVRPQTCVCVGSIRCIRCISIKYIQPLGLGSCICTVRWPICCSMTRKDSINVSTSHCISSSLARAKIFAPPLVGDIHVRPAKLVSVVQRKASLKMVHAIAAICE